MMATTASRASSVAAERLAALHPLDAAATTALGCAVQRPRRVRVRRELLVEGREITEALLILNGWAARVRILEDGRRQVLNFLLPGDLVGLCRHEHPLATSTVIALTDIDVCPAPSANVSPALNEAYAKSAALEEAYLLAQITRLGRLNAQERLVDLLLELLERLTLAGLAVDGRYTMPLTQEVLADTLGLTSVHVNRTLQTMRRDGTVIWKGRELRLPNPEALRRDTGRQATRVWGG